MEATVTMKTESERAAMRVLIAGDVIQHVQSSMIAPSLEGSYCLLREDIRFDEVGHDLRDVLSRQKYCEVCAKGALFHAHVTRFDGVPVTEEDAGEDSQWRFDSNRRVCAVLGGTFDQEQLDLIECAYEGNRIHGEVSDDNDHRSEEFADRFETAPDRLIAIMENIIANGGTFVP